MRRVAPRSRPSPSASICRSAVSFRRQHYFDNTHPNYAGHIGISVSAAAQRSGARCRRSAPRSDTPRRSVEPKLHADRHADAQADAGACAPRRRGTRAALCAGSADPRRHGCVRSSGERAGAGRASAWRAETEIAHRQYLAAIEPAATPGELQLGEVVVWLRENLPEDAIVTNGAGNYCVWVNGYYQYRGYGTQLGPTSGSMGYGTPAAVAASWSIRAEPWSASPATAVS